MNRKMLSGTFWMSFGSIFSRILGVVYLIPWLMMLGSSQNQLSAQAMFNTAYTPYALFLSLGTSGFPTAISRRIAVYNAKNRYLDSQHLFKSGLLFMGVSGIFCGTLLYLAAPAIAKNSPVISYKSTILVIRFLTPALIILPMMSIIRGFFQGNQDMKPFGVSQLIEQFVRVGCILIASYISYCFLKQSLKVAVGLSTFATFFGAIASLGYLGWYYCRQRPNLKIALAKSEPETNMNLKTDFILIIKEAIPFVFVGAGITLSQLIDQFTFKQVMLQTSQLSVTTVQNLFTLFSANPNKITTVVVSLALAISETTMPILASVQFKRQQVTNVVKQNFKMLFGLLIPIIIILALLSPAINTVFFGYSLQGGQLMRWAIIVSFVLAWFTDVFTLIQALGKHHIAVKLLLLGLVIKLGLQYPLVKVWYAYGALGATFIAFLLISIAGTVYIMSYCQVTTNVKLPSLRYYPDFKTLLLVGVVFFGGSLLIYGTGIKIVLINSRGTALTFAVVEGILMLILYGGLSTFYNLPRIVTNIKFGRQYRKYKHFH